MDLTLREIRKTYRGGITALDRLDLDIPPGIFGLLGPNGAGKTTLMRILAGVSQPDHGSVRAGGWDLPMFRPAGGGTACSKGRTSSAALREPSWWRLETRPSSAGSPAG